MINNEIVIPKQKPAFEPIHLIRAQAKVNRRKKIREKLAKDAIEKLKSNRIAEHSFLSEQIMAADMRVKEAEMELIDVEFAAWMQSRNVDLNAISKVATFTDDEMPY